MISQHVYYALLSHLCSLSGSSVLQVYGSRTNNLRLGAVIRHMLEEGGIKSLWRGNAINIVKVVPEMALKFMIYEQVGSGISCFVFSTFCTL